MRLPESKQKDKKHCEYGKKEQICSKKRTG